MKVFLLIHAVITGLTTIVLLMALSVHATVMRVEVPGFSQLLSVTCILGALYCAAVGFVIRAFGDNLPDQGKSLASPSRFHPAVRVWCFGLVVLMLYGLVRSFVLLEFDPTPDSGAALFWVAGLNLFSISIMYAIRQLQEHRTASQR